MVVTYRTAGSSLETSLPEVIGAYKRELRKLRSPLALRADAWLKARRQASSILRDCVAALRGDDLSSQAEMWRYSRGVAVDRVKQGIAISESIRAVEVLWEAMGPAVRAAALSEGSQHRTTVQLLVAAAFRSSASARLYAGAVGYEATQARVIGATSSQEAADDTGDALLSRREREVLTGVEQAMSNAQIARELGIAPATVKRHLYRIYAKLGAVSRVDAINKARARRLLLPSALPEADAVTPLRPTPRASEGSPRIA